MKMKEYKKTTIKELKKEGLVQLEGIVRGTQVIPQDYEFTSETHIRGYLQEESEFVLWYAKLNGPLNHHPHTVALIALLNTSSETNFPATIKGKYSTEFYKEGVEIHSVQLNNIKISCGGN